MAAIRDIDGIGPRYLRVWLVGGGILLSVVALSFGHYGHDTVTQQGIVVVVLGTPLLVLVWTRLTFRFAALLWPFVLAVPMFLFVPTLWLLAVAAWASLITRRPPGGIRLLGLMATVLGAAAISLVAAIAATATAPPGLVVCLIPGPSPDTNAVFDATERAYPASTSRVIATVSRDDLVEVTVDFDDYATQAQVDNTIREIRRSVPGLQAIERAPDTCPA